MMSVAQLRKAIRVLEDNSVAADDSRVSYNNYVETWKRLEESAEKLIAENEALRGGCAV